MIKVTKLKNEHTISESYQKPCCSRLMQSLKYNSPTTLLQYTKAFVFVWVWVMFLVIPPSITVNLAYQVRSDQAPIMFTCSVHEILISSVNLPVPKYTTMT